MSVRLVPKLLIWTLLIISSLGAVSEWTKPEMSDPRKIDGMIVEEQMAISAATNFAREWMAWSGEETPEDRSNRLKPYVSRSQLSRISPLQFASKGTSQKVDTVQFLSLRQIVAGQYAVRVRVTITNPERSAWELGIPVSVKLAKGSVITEPPAVRLSGEPPEWPLPAESEPPSSNTVKQAMKPTIEGFLKAMCEEKEAGNLVNYVGTGSVLVPLQGRVKFISLDDMQVNGTGPYIVKAGFTVQDGATGTKLPQVWKLRVTVENQKFFVQSIE